MGGLETSPQDPVFWLHHSYIDYLWEKFRERQKRLGINSEKDYPPTTDPFHQPNRVMDKLIPEKTNIEGYSNSFTRYIYQYAPIFIAVQEGVITSTTSIGTRWSRGILINISCKRITIPFNVSFFRYQFVHETADLKGTKSQGVFRSFVFCPRHYNFIPNSIGSSIS
jgi:hypothetical protein